MPIKALEDDRQGWPKPDGSHVVLSKKFAEKHADVRGWMENSKLTDEQYASLMLAVSEAKDPAEGAKKWLETPKTGKPRTNGSSRAPALQTWKHPLPDRQASLGEPPGSGPAARSNPGLTGSESP